MNIQWSFEILKLVNTHNEEPNQAIARAKVYRDFMEDRGDPVASGEIPPEKINNLAEPGRRKRRTKAEMDQTITDVPSGPSHLVRDEIQQGMMRLMNESGFEDCEKLLAHFSVTRVPDLKPEQYTECLNMLHEIFEEKSLL